MGPIQTQVRRGVVRPAAGSNTARVMGTVGVLSVLVLALACTPSPAAPPSGAGKTDAGNLEMTRLTIGTARDPNLGSQLIIAKEMGYFKDNGLNDVSLQFFPSGGDLVSAMAAKAVPMGSGGSVPTTTLRAGGFNAQVLAQQADISGAQQIVARQQILKPKDLEGKKIATNFGTVSEMLVLSMMKEFGLARDKVTLVNMGPAEMVTAITRGDVDAASLWEPWSTQAVKGGARRLVTGTTSYAADRSGPLQLVGDHALLIADAEFISKNPQTVTAVMKSLLEATRLIDRDPDKAAEVVGQELKVEPTEMKTMMSQNRYTMAIDGKLASDMNTLSAFLSQAGKLKSPVKADDWVNPDPLKKVQPDLVSWTPSK